MTTIAVSDSEGEIEEEDEEEDRRRVCPYKTLTECIGRRQGLDTERNQLKKKLEGEGGRGSLSLLEIENVKARIEALEDDIAVHGVWAIELQKGKYDKHRKALPIAAKLDILKEHCSANRVVIVTGSTGSGKSTQVPQFLYDSCQTPGHVKPILVAQTRRIATTSIAARIALERGEVLGKSVGFTIGGFNACSKKAKIHFVTMGVLVAMLTSGDALRKYSYIVVDEVHERTLEIDIALSLLRSNMRKRNTRIKLVIMSATMEDFKSKLQSYFSTVNRLHTLPESDPDPRIPIVSSAQRLNYNVSYLDDVDYSQVGLTVLEYKSALKRPKKVKLTDERMLLAVKLIKNLHEVVLPDESNILVFTPGIGDMTEMFTRLEQLIDLESATLLCLHSTVSVDEQNRVFQSHDGKRMIVLSTNIAESAITIKSLGVVIDFCLHKENVHDYTTNISSLTLQWVSKAMASQRAGRCGRSFAGSVYRLVTRAEYTEFNEMTKPEIQIAPLQTTCLKILNMKWLYASYTDVESFILDLLDPPESEANIKSALRDLVDYKCAEHTSTLGHRLTYLGKLAALFPLDLHASLLVIYGHLFNCFDDALVIAAARSRSRSVIINPYKQPLLGAMLHLSYAGPCLSDEIATVNAYHFWQRRRQTQNEKEWCLSKGLSLPALKEVHDMVMQLRQVGSKMGLCLPPGHAEKGRRLEDKLKAVELLAASDADECVTVSLGLEKTATATELAGALLLSLTLEAADEHDKKIIRKNVKKQLEAAYTSNDAKLLSWLLEDGIRETEASHLPVDKQFSITTCMAAAELHHVFVIGSAPHEGAYPLSTVKGDVPDFYLDLELSHELVFDAEPGADGGEAVYKAAQKRFEDQIRLIRNIGQKAALKVKHEPTLPVRSMVLRPLRKRIEMYFKPSAVGRDSDAGWYCQAGCHKTYVLRVASRLLDRQVQVPKPIKVKEAVQKAARDVDGALKLPGRKVHTYLRKETVAVAKVKPHHSVAGCGLLTYAGKKTTVMPRSCSVTFPFLLLRKGTVGWGFGSRMSGKKSRLHVEGGTVVMGCLGTPEVLTLLMDVSADIESVTYNDDRLRATVRYTTTRNNVKKTVEVEMDSAVLTHLANMKDVGHQKMTRLYTAYVDHLKRLHKENMIKRSDLPEFDESKLVPNSWTNPLAEYADIDCYSSDDEQPPIEENPDGVILQKKGFAVVNKKADDEFYNEVVRKAAVGIAAACEPRAVGIRLPNDRATLLTS